MNFTFAQIVVTLRLEKNIDRNYFYGLRSAFARAFRLSVNCGSHSSCNGCRDNKACCYPRIFSQLLTSDPLAIKRYQKPSCPFAFHFPILSGRTTKGASVEIGLTLVGVAIEYFEPFLKALTITTLDSLSLLKAESVDYAGNRYLVMEEGGETYCDRIFIFSSAALHKTSMQLPGVITIDILTPMRLVHQGSPLREISFSSFARALLRRVSSLAYYYEGIELEYDFKWLAEQSREVKTLQSNFGWTEWKGTSDWTRFSGVTGRATFSGNLDDFHLFLLLGQYMNLGKGATFGLGRYIILGS